MEGQYLKAWVDWLERYQRLDDAEFGRLMRAALEYKRSGAVMSLPVLEELLFDGIKLDIDRDIEKYETKRAVNSENGKKGGRPKKADAISEKRTKRTVFLETEKRQEEEKEKEEDKDKEKDKDNIPPKSPKGELFEKFWAAYPKKVGIQAAKKAWSRLKPNKELTEAILQAVERQKSSIQWSTNNGQFIPNPARWLNEWRWEDKVQTQTSCSSGVQSGYTLGESELNAIARLKQLRDEIKGDADNGTT